jgi:hypothetical protein
VEDQGLGGSQSLNGHGYPRNTAPGQGTGQNIAETSEHSERTCGWVSGTHTSKRKAESWCWVRRGFIDSRGRVAWHVWEACRARGLRPIMLEGGGSER